MHLHLYILFAFRYTFFHFEHLHLQFFFVTSPYFFCPFSKAFHSLCAISSSALLQTPIILCSFQLSLDFNCQMSVIPLSSIRYIVHQREHSENHFLMKHSTASTKSDVTPSNHLPITQSTHASDHLDAS